MRGITKTWLAVFIGLVIVGGGAWYFISQGQQTSRVNFVLAAPDASNLSANLNEQPLALRANGSVTKNLHPGDYDLTVKKPGYQDFSTTFTVHKHEKLLINISLARTSIPDLTSLSQLNPVTKTTNWELSSTQFFGNHDWVIVQVTNTAVGSGLIIGHYDDVNQSWKIISGPDTIVAQSLLPRLPLDMQQYLQDNNYVEEGF